MGRCGEGKLANASGNDRLSVVAIKLCNVLGPKIVIRSQLYVPVGSLELPLAGGPTQPHGRDCRSAGRQMVGPLGNTLTAGRDANRTSLVKY